jgi:hypothetical protein
MDAEKPVAHRGEKHALKGTDERLALELEGM